MFNYSWMTALGYMETMPDICKSLGSCGAPTSRECALGLVLDQDQITCPTRGNEHLNARLSASPDTMQVRIPTRDPGSSQSRETDIPRTTVGIHRETCRPGATEDILGEDTRTGVEAWEEAQQAWGMQSLITWAQDMETTRQGSRAPEQGCNSSMFDLPYFLLLISID